MNTPPATPKRKRPGPQLIITVADKVEQHVRPQLNLDTTPNPDNVPTTNSSQHRQVQEAGDVDASDAVCDSPRTQVADRLGVLALRGPRACSAADNNLLDEIAVASGDGYQLVHSDDDDYDQMQLLDSDSVTPRGGRKKLRLASELEARHIPSEAKVERNDDGGLRRMTPPPEHNTELYDSDNQNEIRSSKKQAKGLKTSSPTPPPIDGKIDGIAPKTGELTINDLTWHDSEITGHLGLDPDDDGTGINGIGFRPSPQQTYARSQRRKQQLKEWREREGREERKRRYERRGHVIADSSKPEVSVEQISRVVRFA